MGLQKILIVDDRPENLLALRTVLGELDIEFIEATNGNDALAATLYHSFALAILDIVMPGMDGYELANLLRGDPRTRRLPIIFMTAAYGEEDHIFKGYEAGAVDYIVKPYNPRVLLSKVSVFLELDRKNTALVEKLEALAASEERFRSLVMTVPDIVYRIDREGCFTFLNDAIHDLGYTPDELIGKNFSEIMLPEDAEAVSRKSALLKYAGKETGSDHAPRLFDERRTGARKTAGLEVRLVPRHGGPPVPGVIHCNSETLITAEVSSSGLYSTPFGKGQSVFLGSVGIIRDITERKQVEKELERHRKHLEELVEERIEEIRNLNLCLEQRVAERTAELTAANRELDSFAYAVSHDLRAPLRAMSGFSQALVEDYSASLPEEALSYLEQIDLASHKMGELIDGLLTLSRSTRGELQHDAVDLSDLAGRVLAELARSDPERRVATEVEAGLQIYGDARMIEVMMRNLLGNAWKYTAHAAAPCIRLHAEEHAGRCWFCVADNGAGFNMAYASKLFQPFQRLHSQQEFPGIGIGLATVLRIVNRHGGAIEAKAEPGQGAEFHFTLPDLLAELTQAEETQ